MSGRHEEENEVNVQVLLRCRPVSEEEVRNNALHVITCDESQREVAVKSITGEQIDRVFTFDKVFGPSAEQKDLYEQAVVPIVNEVLKGFNCTILAYGQPGTGKTYTMEGECKRSKIGPNGELPPESGVIPRAAKQIFDILESQDAEYNVKLKVTFLELYNGEITDLLVALEQKQKKQLTLVEDGNGGFVVRALREVMVTSVSEIFTLLERGSAKRRTAETLLNKHSSRSHSFFSIAIHIKEATPEGKERKKCSKLNLVDLAALENISNSGAVEGRAREVGEINKSLVALGRVINALVEHQGVGHTPYRDSMLTKLLCDSLGGRTKTCIIATVSPAVHCLQGTLSILNCAHSAKHIKNKPQVNPKMMKSTHTKDLCGEIGRRKAVHAAREKKDMYILKEQCYQEESERKMLREEVSFCKRKVEELEGQHHRAQAMAEQIEKMGVTIQALQTAMASMSHQNELLKEEVSFWKRRIEELEGQHHLARAMAEQIEQMGVTIEALQTAMASMSRQNEQLKEEVSFWKRRIEELEGQHHRAQVRKRASRRKTFLPKAERRKRKTASSSEPATEQEATTEPEQRREPEETTEQEQRRELEENTSSCSCCSCSRTSTCSTRRCDCRKALSSCKELCRAAYCTNFKKRRKEYAVT